jgi:protein-disulfide isomerase
MSPVEEEDEQDLTRKQRREQARTERKALEQAEAANQQRRKRLIQLGSVAGVVVVIIVVIVAATSGGGGSPVPPKKVNPGEKNKAVETVTKEIGGIPQKANVLGSAKAPVTLVYFGDLQCPICKDFTLGALPTLIQKYVRTGKLRVEYRNLETATREPETFKTQQVAALAAGKQNKGWYYIELFYNQQGQEDSEYVTEQYLRTLAEQTPGLNLPSWTAARNDPEFTNTITSDAQAANAAGFTGTPSFQIGKTGGPVQKLEYQSLTDPAAFEAAINKLI